MSTQAKLKLDRKYQQLIDTGTNAEYERRRKESMMNRKAAPADWDKNGPTPAQRYRRAMEVAIERENEDERVRLDAELTKGRCVTSRSNSSIFRW